MLSIRTNTGTYYGNNTIEQTQTKMAQMNIKNYVNLIFLNLRVKNKGTMMVRIRMRSRSLWINIINYKRKKRMSYIWVLIRVIRLSSLFFIGRFILILN
jgi:hypothetical protein